MPRALTHPDLAKVPLTSVMHALSDPVRLRIVMMAAAAAGPLPCKSFIDAIPKSTLSHHWRVLREAGLLRQESVGTTRQNTLRRAELDARFPGLLDAILADALHRRSKA